jgi:hypothetical protein
MVIPFGGIVSTVRLHVHEEQLFEGKASSHDVISREYASSDTAMTEGPHENDPLTSTTVSHNTVPLDMRIDIRTSASPLQVKIGFESFVNHEYAKGVVMLAIDGATVSMENLRSAE